MLKKHPQVGDLVQWLSQGSFRFRKAKKLLAISPDGQYGFVEGTNTGLPIDQLIYAGNNDGPNAL